MKKPTGKEKEKNQPQNNNQGKKDDKSKGKVNNTKNTKVEEEVPRLTLVIDSNDVYQQDLSVFYIHPARLSHISYLTDKIFDEVVVKNSSVENLSSMNLNYVLKKMKVDAPLEIIVYQPLSVMQSYDAKQIEANAKLAGYDKIETTEVEVEVNKVKTKTLRVAAVRPERNPNSIEIEIQVTKKTVVTK